MEDQERVHVIETRIVRELTQYLEQKGEGLPMQVLSAKYSRALNDLGGFPEAMEAMRVKGLIRVEYSDNGARTVFPITEKDRVAEIRQWL